MTATVGQLKFYELLRPGSQAIFTAVSISNAENWEDLVHNRCDHLLTHNHYLCASLALAYIYVPKESCPPALLLLVENWNDINFVDV